jgi:hypothetical protein
MASQGVHLAMSSSTQATIVVNTLLRHPENTDLALAFYQESQQSRINQFVERTAFEYARAAQQWKGSFWQDRGVGAPEKLNKPTEKPYPIAQQAVKLCSKAAFLATPILKETFVGSQLALHHPKLDRPVAFLGNQSIVPLLKQIKSEESIEAIIAHWKSEISPDLGKQIVQWLWQHEVLVGV